MIGYAATEYDFIERAGSQVANWKGGWNIYAVPFEAALKPATRLVYDVRSSDEHWLVHYSKDTAEYVPVLAGKMFFHNLIMVGRNGKSPTFEMTLYIEVKWAEGLRFSKRHFLEKGCWRIEGTAPQNVFSANDDKEYKVTRIPESEYKEMKSASADLLSFNDNVPASLQWTRT
jgi:hypothetical protein